uniref:Uncharacterized protein n=1 Tax=Rhizochromulina marina TaxID=1034831 RepID=A0A7S2S7Y4_9STRA|mmetsp:Transcript_26377/g.76903  ORF Transcript_26377/g.76903 Transcript_26377/m.76903 type:complete len:453 (+) Transcript_26377:201-1559(+)
MTAITRTDACGPSCGPSWRRVLATVLLATLGLVARPVGGGGAWFGLVPAGMDQTQDPPARWRRLASSLRGGERWLRDGSVWFLRPQATPPHSLDSEAQGHRTPCSSSNPVQLPPPIVVVGTDGSGTRAVSKLLSMLNVTLLVERSVYHQLDVDGSKAGLHFTSTIRDLLRFTASLLYRPEDLPHSVRGPCEALSKAFSSFLQANMCQAVSDRPPSSEALSSTATGSEALSHHGIPPDQSPAPEPRLWAFKKPDLMNLVPFLAQDLPGMQLIHVVRDGRDMAFSENHAALHKYITALFPQTSPSPSMSGMDIASSDAEKQLLLWNKQNVELYRAATEVSSLASSGGFGYHWLRIEDLASGLEGAQACHTILRNIFLALGTSPPSLAHVESALQQLQAASLGSHDIHAADSHVQSRFGKWKRLATLEQQHDMTILAAEGLHLFGYDFDGHDFPA